VSDTPTSTPADALAPFRPRRGRVVALGVVWASLLLFGLIAVITFGDRPTIVQDYDFQVASTDFLQTKLADRPEPKDSLWDSAKPHDWTKPKDPAPETKPLRAD